jgi:hypothetical protein
MAMSFQTTIKFLRASVLVAPTLCSTIAFGWGDMGHQVVGEIAEQIINRDRKTKAAIQEIIGIEPFAFSSVWPDHVRDDARFDDMAPYHYHTIHSDPKKLDEKSAYTVLQRYKDLVVSATVPRATKMIALRFIMHVVGDVHQPLHIGNPYDRGGNSCQVFWMPKPGVPRPDRPTNLHSVWDTNMVEVMSNRIREKLNPEPRYFSYKHVTQNLVRRYASLLSSQQSADYNVWIRESELLRKNSVYPDSLPEDKRPYCAISKLGQTAIKPNLIPVLDQEYVAKRIDIVEKQLVLGGMRLAEYLKDTFKKTNANEPTESEILGQLQQTTVNKK